MNLKRIQFTISVFTLLIFISIASSENIDPYEDGSQYAYGENVGWLNFEPEEVADAHVTESELNGFVWAENIGWINLSPASYGGVLNDGAGNLSGYAWGENVGWINFAPTNGGVTIDSDGDFSGWAWGENIGWINFNSAQLYGYNVKVCVVGFDDLAEFCDQWLDTGSGLTADLYFDMEVNFKDFSIFASWWFSYCPDGWQLK